MNSHMVGPDPDARKVRLCLVAALVIIGVLAWVGSADAAPLTGQPVQFTAKLFAVHCWAGFCNAGVELRYDGVLCVGYLWGWHLRDGQYVTVTATVNDWRLESVRRVWR